MGRETNLQNEIKEFFFRRNKTGFNATEMFQMFSHFLLQSAHNGHKSIK
jgi:hypothetical protein